MTLRWGKWLTTWATFKKRLPSLAWAATILLAMATDANIVAALPERYHFVLRYIIGGATAALLYTRSVATGAHSEDYVRGLVPERRGTGDRTGEMPAVSGSGEARGFAPPAHGVADGGTHDDDGRAL